MTHRLSHCHMPHVLFDSHTTRLPWKNLNVSRDCFDGELTNPPLKGPRNSEKKEGSERRKSSNFYKRSLRPSLIGWRPSLLGLRKKNKRNTHVVFHGAPLKHRGHEAQRSASRKRRDSSHGGLMQPNLAICLFFCAQFVSSVFLFNSSKFVEALFDAPYVFLAVTLMLGLSRSTSSVRPSTTNG